MQVQLLLNKLSSLEVKTICPLHGPILDENIEYYINKYNIWSKYESEDDGIFIAYNSIHGNTRKAVEYLDEILKYKGVKNVIVTDLARCDMAEAIEDAFRYSKLIVATPTYDAGLFPFTETFLNELKHKNYQNKKIGIIENGSWAPMAAKCVKEALGNMKNIVFCDTIVTIKSKMKEENKKELNKLVDEILGGEK